MKREWKENESSSKSSVGKIVGIVLAVVLLTGGGYLVYRFWLKKSSEQVQQEQEKKDELRRQIKLIEDKISQTKKALVEKKAGRQYEYKTFDEPFKKITFDNPNQETNELLKKKIDLWNEYADLSNKILELVNKQSQEIKDKRLAVWDRQKDGNWTLLTEKLDKDHSVKVRFSEFINYFYRRYKEAKNISTHLKAHLEGFGGFYIDIDNQGRNVTEMGHTGPPEGVKSHLVNQGGRWFVKDYPMQISLNQLYLLNNGRNPGGRMNEFYSRKPVPSDEGHIYHLDISFDKLINTIAHEIAHAIQNAKNLSDDKITKANKLDENGKERWKLKKLSDCWDSGKGEWDEKNHILIKPKYPELVKEHKNIEKEVEQMIKSDTQVFPSFKTWWEASS